MRALVALSEFHLSVTAPGMRLGFRFDICLDIRLGLL